MKRRHSTRQGLVWKNRLSTVSPRDPVGWSNSKRWCSEVYWNHTSQYQVGAFLKVFSFWLNGRPVIFIMSVVIKLIKWTIQFWLRNNMQQKCKTELSEGTFYLDIYQWQITKQRRRNLALFKGQNGPKQSNIIVNCKYVLQLYISQEQTAESALAISSPKLDSWSLIKRSLIWWSSISTEVHRW